MSREATIQRIIDVQPVENSDFLDVVKVLGWQVVTKRGDFRVGDLCVYIALDSIVRESMIFEFLRKEKFRIKTKRLRGALSQGIVFPITILADYPFPFLIEEDLDISNVLGVTHYEKPIPPEMRGLIKGNFPPYIPKTDEDRIQNYPDVINELRGVKVYSTVKCDGTSWTIGCLNDEINVCSRNNALKLEGNDDNIYIKMMYKYDLQDKLLKYGKNIAIQAELCGEGIQKNHLKLKGHKLFVFNVWFIDEQRYANFEELKQVCRDLQLEMVPIIDIWYFNNSVDELLEMAKGVYEDTNNFREGIVIRPVVEMVSRAMNGRMSIKCLNNDFLLKNKE